MPIDSGNLALKGLDDLFSTEEKRQEEQWEQVQQIPIDDLHPFTKSNPVPSAMMPTQSVSPANNREIRPFFMPSIIYTPNSFLRRFNKNWLA